MNKIQHDKNMVIKTSINKPDIKFYDIDDEPFRIYGIWREGDKYHRMPQAVADTVSKGISEMCAVCAGGRVRFVTDSPYVAIKVEYGNYELSCMTPTLAMAGFDAYADGKFAGAFRPAVDFDGSPLESVLELGEKKERLVTINFPLYTEVKSMLIGLSDSAIITHAPDYTLEKPVVFYGSSITNGAGASRPGATYVSRVARELDINFHCLGFGGLAKGEAEMADYIASLDMSAFVMDYDHNAKNTEYLTATHEPFFKKVRRAHPNIPIILVSRPDLAHDTQARFEVIKTTYENAKKNGDENVYLVNGMDFFGGDLDYTVDRVHPSDLGYYFMAKGIEKALRPLI